MHLLKSLSKSEVISSTRKAIAVEKKSTLEVLYHLREIERRKIFAELGYSSMFECVTKEFNYEEAAALRRIAASRLIAEIPEIAESVQKGELSLSHLSQAQNYFRKELKFTGEKVARVEKLEVLESLKKTSTREAERKLVMRILEKHPEVNLASLQPERVKVVSPDCSEVTLTFNKELMEKLEKLKGLLSHKKIGSYAELIEELADQALKKSEKMLSKVEPKKTPVTKILPSAQKVRYVSQDLRRHAWFKAQGRCEFVGINGNRCESQWGLQVDHIKPVAKGGQSIGENLRLLCWTHNQLEAVRQFGREKIERCLQR